jgi:hypothetical protein
MGEALVRLVPSMKASRVFARHHSSLRCGADFVTRASVGYRLFFQEAGREERGVGSKQSSGFSPTRREVRKSPVAASNEPFAIAWFNFAPLNGRPTDQ